jgi:hypothetical protein
MSFKAIAIVVLALCVTGTVAAGPLEDAAAAPDEGSQRIAVAQHQPEIAKRWRTAYPPPVTDHWPCLAFLRRVPPKTSKPVAKFLSGFFEHQGSIA